MVVQRMLWRLYNIESTIEGNTKAIETKNGELSGLRAELTRHEDALSAAQRQQARARGDVMKKEQAIKKQEKALEAKVCSWLRRRHPNNDITFQETCDAGGGYSNCSLRTQN
jgi:septal ring factor EnvC (AmiA/AmiB activator)